MKRSSKRWWTANPTKEVYRWRALCTLFSRSSNSSASIDWHAWIDRVYRANRSAAFWRFARCRPSPVSIGHILDAVGTVPGLDRKEIWKSYVAKDERDETLHNQPWQIVTSTWNGWVWGLIGESLRASGSLEFSAFNSLLFSSSNELIFLGETIAALISIASFFLEIIFTVAELDSAYRIHDDHSLDR